MTPVEIIGQHLANAPAIVAGARRAGADLPVVAALVEGESQGRNIFGHDVGGLFYVRPPAEVEVTEARVRQLVAHVRAGGVSQGVGLTQLTWPGFFERAARESLRLWDPEDNVTLGATVLLELLGGDARGDLAAAAALYRSGTTTDPVGVAYAAAFIRRVTVWRDRLSTAPSPTSSPAPSVAPTVPQEDPMPTPMLTGLGRVLDSAGVQWTGVPGWEARTGFASGYRDVYGAVVHTTETADAAFARGADAPTLAHVVDADGSIRGAHTYAMLIGRSGHVHLVAAGPGWQAGHGSWPAKLGPNPGVRDDEANFHTLGISMDANESCYPVTEAQLVALVKVLAALRKEWAPDRFDVLMHGEWQPVGHPGAQGRTDPTRVPGGWDAIRRAVDAGTWTTTTQARPQATLGAAGAAASVASPSVRPGTVTVRAGETLAGIAKAHGTTWQVLAQLNALADPNSILAGQVLRLPAPTATSPAAARHTVAKGEGLWGIARQHGLTVDELCRLNGLTRTATIHPGQVLKVKP